MKDKKSKKKIAYQEIFDNLNVDEVTNFADLGATSPNFAAQMHSRFDCDIALILIDRDGKPFSKNSNQVKKYLQRLEKRGVTLDRVEIVEGPSESAKYDIISTLKGFGSAYKAKPAMASIQSLMHDESRLVMDIKKGSGGYPLLRPLGNINTVHKYEEDGTQYARVILTPEPAIASEQHESAPLSNDQQWQKKAEEYIGENGFFIANDMHSFTYVPRSKTLVVTFDNLNIAMENRGDRLPWGFSFIERENYSMLGVMAGGWTWYRDPWVYSQFDRLREEGFFEQFERVVFYGASMGAYGALVFSRAAPGSDVVVFSPQTTIDKKIVPWETRYKVAWGHDYSGFYGDAKDAIPDAGNIFLFYDPYAPLDMGHAKRLRGDNVHHFRAPLMGHKVGSSFLRMKILKPLVISALKGELNQEEYRKLFAERKKLRRYLISLFNRAKDEKHYRLALRVADFALLDAPKDGFFIKNKAEIEKKLA